jgi:pimeloyl-ACP methyl ester carboxylesterase
MTPRTPAPPWPVSAGVLLLCGLTLPSCSGITVHKHRPPEPLAVVADGSADPALADAEAAYRKSQTFSRFHSDEALAAALDCAGRTYPLLVDAEADSRAVALYNAAVARCLRLTISAGRIDCRRDLSLPGLAPAPVVHTGFAWPAEAFGRLEMCDEFRVGGRMRERHRPGVGVPVMVTRLSNPHTTGRDYLLPDAAIPATALLHFDDPHAPRLELVNPLSVEAVSCGNVALPLAADFTTPLCRSLTRDFVDRLAYEGFFRADRVRDRTGLVLFEPYEPGKIPVLLLHGLLSAPLTWAPLLNDLRADPVLRERYQFWAYFYPSGNPFPTSASDLRAALDKLRAEIDPGRRDPALDQMVVVGHSMGGLLGKLLTVDGGDDFWRVVSACPLDELKLSSPVREQLRETFFFSRRNDVKRVVFIATPHHGSELSPSAAGRMAARLVRLRDDLAAANAEMRRVITDLPHGRVPTSVELLAPDSTALHVLAERTAPPDVRYHSIIGFKPGSDAASDGVVSYASSHLEGVASERLVPAGHTTVHQHPETVAEVRRILLEHLRSIP